MSEFSTTRIADFNAALTGNASLGPAIVKLKNVTGSQMARLSDLEIYETIASAVANGTFVITFGGVAIP
jgi:hypothetical protein